MADFVFEWGMFVTVLVTLGQVRRLVMDLNAKVDRLLEDGRGPAPR